MFYFFIFIFFNIIYFFIKFHIFLVYVFLLSFITIVIFSFNSLKKHHSLLYFFNFFTSVFWNFNLITQLSLVVNIFLYSWVNIFIYI